MKNKITLKKSALVLVMLVAFTNFVNAQIPSYVPSNGLVGYWPFNGNANDQSGNGNNGTVNGATLTTDRFGNSNSAYSFDGVNDFISTSYSGILGTNSRSVSFWYNSFTNNIDETVFTDYGGAPNCGEGFACTLFPSNEPGVDNTGSYIKSNSMTSVNNWNFYTVTYNSSDSPFIYNCKLYINGVLQSTSQSSTICDINTINDLNMVFGSSRLFNPVQYFNGKIDDIGIWNRALSQQEITNIYNGVNYSDTCNAVSGSLTNGLVGYWPFCGNANDDSGNGNNGTVNGATLSTDRFGNSNSAYDFDGNSFISVSSTTELCLQNQFTISLWARRNNSTFMGLISKGRDNGGEGVSYHISGLENGVEVGINNDTGGCSSCNVGTTPYLSNNFSSWNHYVGIWDGIRLKLYENGIMVSDVNGVLGDGNALINTNFPLLFGRWSLNNYLNGQLDDIGIWNRALTPQEITQLFNQNQCTTNITVTDTLVINVGQLSYTNPVTYNNTITIYPNPANDHITIDCGTIANVVGYHIEIVNSLGQVVFNQPMNTQQYTVALNTWSGQGIYFVKVYDASNTLLTTRKLILQ